MKHYLHVLCLAAVVITAFLTGAHFVEGNQGLTLLFAVLTGWNMFSVIINSRSAYPKDSN